MFVFKMLLKIGLKLAFFIVMFQITPRFNSNKFLILNLCVRELNFFWQCMSSFWRTKTECVSWSLGSLLKNSLFELKSSPESSICFKTFLGFSEQFISQWICLLILTSNPFCCSALWTLTASLSVIIKSNRRFWWTV